MKSLQLRSRISIAIADTRGMATLTACMSDEPREWTAGDIELMEKVATQLRSCVALARVQMREHRIASDLQAALLPTLPSSIPGLDIGSCMQPALDEAEIGGDFFDVFELNKGRYALVVGDVSGKGLAAAGQLAVVRNCLRMSFYEHQRPAKALTNLNIVLTANNLLSGFVTAVAMIYDPAQRLLTYSSCGHEPVLLRRFESGTVEILHAEGVPLGVTEIATYAENTTALKVGDMLLMYTDGLSESGPSRKEMLGTDGLVTIIEQLELEANAINIAYSVINHAKILTNGPLHDDVCVLTGICTG